MTDTDLKGARADLAAIKALVFQLDQKLSPPPRLDQPSVRAICDALETAGWERAPKTERRERA